MNWSKLESQLRNSKNEWQFKVYRLIKTCIPRGHVITYGGLAKRANKKYGLNINARNTAKLRDMLYVYFPSHSAIPYGELPLHRIAKKGDSTSKWDSPMTQKDNKRLRSQEGSWPEPLWLYK